MEKVHDFLNTVSSKIWVYIPKFLLAAIILFFGFKIIKRIVSLIGVLFKKSGVSSNVQPFLISIITVLFKVGLFLAVASVLGIELSIFTTIIAASVFAVGMALQGSLGNFASGLLVLSLKPYNVEDWIEIDKKFGKVEEIGVFSTKIVTPGNKTLIIPNSKITNDVVTNYSEKGMVRLEIDITMPYAESFPKVKGIIEKALEEVPLILKTPSPEIGIEGFNSHNVQLTVRPYAKPDDYWEVTFNTHEVLKQAFSENNIEVAYSEGIAFGAIGN